MAKEMKIPAVGESITEVTIANWLVEDGDTVEMDDPICELESDKATFEVPAEASGKIIFKAQAGDTLNIGDLLCVIEESSSENGSTSKADETPKAEATAPATNGKSEEYIMKVPAVGESISEVVLANWLVEDGEDVELDDPICELESDKATFEVPAEKAGKVFRIANVGDTLAIGAEFAKIKVGADAATEPKKETLAQTSNMPASSSSDASKSSYAQGHPSPAANKILNEKGINPKDVQGTGVGGRITKEDALNAKQAEKKEVKKAENTSAAQANATPAGERTTTRERMSSLRKTIAKRLVAAKNQTAMLTTFNEVDMSAVMELRKKYKDKFKDKHEVGLGFMSFFTKAVAMALEEIPGINAQIDGDEIIYHNYADVSIAVSSPRGLVVPVIRNAEQLSFAEIEKEVVRLAVRARDGKLTIEEMSNGTFTITNGGIFGSMLSTPIINSPQSAILGLHNIVERPVAINGEVKIRPIMYIALSYDHRIVDGKESVTFLYRIKELIEDPTRLLLGV